MANDDDQVIDQPEEELVQPDFEEPALDELLDEEEDTPEDVLNSGQYFDDISDDSVRLHLREIGKIPLLNAQEAVSYTHLDVYKRQHLCHRRATA